MRSGTIVVAGLLTFVVLMGSGCVSLEEYNRVVAENESYLSRIQGLEAQQEGCVLGTDGVRSQLADCQIQNRACAERVAVLEAARASLLADMERLAEQVGQAALPVELNNALTDWAIRRSDLVTYDPESGVVRFNSDLLFDPGSDTVQDAAANQLRTLANILNSSAAENFDVLIVGHTDDIRIGQPETLQRHPTNWHLSAHRAIAVEDILKESGVPEARMAVVGRGEFQPIEPNRPGRTGNPRNRRVEIYIVPAGSVRMSGR
ncbi:MAG: OmpA family protein [Sedimentisphaerales bacterium]|nr:OmpA family protein [Sedimentisphaerales bacterium]